MGRGRVVGAAPRCNVEAALPELRAQAALEAEVLGEFVVASVGIQDDQVDVGPAIEADSGFARGARKLAVAIGLQRREDCGDDRQQGDHHTGNRRGVDDPAEGPQAALRTCDPQAESGKCEAPQREHRCEAERAGAGSQQQRARRPEEERHSRRDEGRLAGVPDRTEQQEPEDEGSARDASQGSDDRARRELPDVGGVEREDLGDRDENGLKTCSEHASQARVVLMRRRR